MDKYHYNNKAILNYYFIYGYNYNPLFSHKKFNFWIFSYHIQAIIMVFLFIKNFIFSYHIHAIIKIHYGCNQNIVCVMRFHYNNLFLKSYTKNTILKFHYWQIAKIIYKKSLLNSIITLLNSIITLLNSIIMKNR